MKIEGEILHKALASLKSTYDTVCKAVAPHHDHVNGLEELNSIKPDVLSAIDNIYQLRAKDRHRDRTQRLVYDNISKIAQSIARFASQFDSTYQVLLPAFMTAESAKAMLPTHAKAVANKERSRSDASQNAANESVILMSVVLLTLYLVRDPQLSRESRLALTLQDLHYGMK
eukprot:TRINITY_DN12450_c0_g1_i10.p1 TRINITY_DN12450_c0_g1~~TRINITY_DN12450_c0_g1_i10.p1  ORF type:complete len:172 (+),score=13.07 TRINITY_DN12450_c0_g1_i10:602-1117(+)